LSLQGLTNLTDLDLWGTGVTAAGLEDLVNLTRLSLSPAAVTNAGLARLRGLTKLTHLNLSAGEVTDAGLAHLKGLTTLTDLDLGRTGVTDAGLISTLVFLPFVLVVLMVWLGRQRPGPIDGLPALPKSWRLAFYVVAIFIPACVTLVVWARDRQTPYMKLGQSITISGLALAVFLVVYSIAYHAIEDWMVANARR
jgi:hypothetical protein